MRNAQAAQNKASQVQRGMAKIGLILGLTLATGVAMAATTGTEFQGAYQFIYDAATGYLGRAIAIVGGVIGLGTGAATGKALPAVVGIVLAIFGALGPTIIDSIFGSAII